MHGSEQGMSFQNTILMATLASLALVACGGGGDASSGSSSSGSATTDAVTITYTDVVTAANAFLATLSSSQLSTAQTTWSLANARQWSNLPASMVSRNGIAWGSLSTAQQQAARNMIAAALSGSGNTLHAGMQTADTYLNSIGGGSSYGAGSYYIAFLGTPSSSGLWSLQLTGHHLTYNITYNGSYASATPVFMGVEPKASFSLSGATFDPMQAQRVAVANMGAALTSYSAAKLSTTYSDLVFGANGSGNIDGTCPRAYSSKSGQGALYANLSSTDQALVQEVIKSYVNTQSSSIASELLSVYLSDTALASTYVAYSGTGTVTTKGNYFRIDGPRVWIEFSVQNGVIISNDIHYHTVWRDKIAEYGGACGQS